MSRNRCDGLLAKVDFPLYTLQTLTDRHVLVAGGGGASNTGVANGFEIFELSYNGTKFVAEEVMRYETGPNVVMTCSVQNVEDRIYLAAGQESHCQLYKVNVRMVDPAEMRRGSFRAENGLVRRRRTVSENDNISKNSGPEKRMSFEIRPCDSVQTDFGKDPLQRVVTISHDGKLMATGGVDGKVRLWSFPKMQLLFELNGHTKELDDLDFSPCSKQLVSIAKDGLLLVWNAKAGGAPQVKLTCPETHGGRYLFRRCRFGAIEDVQGKYRMFTIANPLTRSGKARGLLQQWEPVSGQVCRTVVVAESLSALAVRDDGRYVGVGTMFTGSIHIYVAFSLQRVLHVSGAHGMFVTGVQWARAASLPHCEAALLSISVDNRLVVHTLPSPGSMPAWVAVLLIVFVLFCTFCLCSYLGI
ncbi:prolactin regulatory element-binding protein [Danaus plexippus]|uniref:Prolactin regulatory binding-element protein n=6 Tax=Danaini TaxID=30248 RepID=A0A212EWJ1_DANPL|nr:prolactin regulatory element-binding protein [Danaus plexippus]OWR45868.1 prolactin regulatory binding-element protein [Danaus plexippus plexippus]